MAPKSATASYLETLLSHWTAAWNARDFSLTKTAQECLQHIDTDKFRYFLQSGKSLTWPEVIEYQETNTLPGHLFNVTSIQANVKEELGWASVHLQGTWDGLRAGSEGLNFVYAIETCWRFNEEGEWMCYEMSAVRATPIHMGFV